MNTKKPNTRIPRLLLISIAASLSIALAACSTGENTEQQNVDTSAATEHTAMQASTQKTSPENTADDIFPYTFEQVTDNTWVMHGPREFPNPQNRGFMNNPGVVKTSAGLVVIDPGSTRWVGEQVLAKIKNISDEPVVAVFNTHIHGDHWLANQAIKAAYPEVKIYGHPEMLKAIENGEGDNWVDTMNTLTEGASAGTKVVAPNNTVDNEAVITVGDTRFRVHHFGVAHTKTDIMIEAVEDSVVFLGDNVLAKRIPRTSDGTYQGNIKAIKTILGSDAKTYVPGHGPTGDKTMVEDYLNYLELIYAAAKKAFDEDLDSSDVITITRETTTAYKDWAGYDDLLGPHGAQAYSEVEEAEF